MNTKVRLYWIDIAKAISMLSIMMCHTIANQSNIWNLMTGFNVTLFFVLTGYTLKEDTPIGAGVKRDIKSILGPFFFMTIIIYLFSVIVYKANPVQYFLFQMSSILVTGTGYISYLWFLIVLFWTKTVYRYMLKHFRAGRTIIIMILGYISMIAGNFRPMPQYLDIWFAAMIFMELGHLIRKYHNGRDELLDQTKAVEVNFVVRVLERAVCMVVAFIWIFYTWERGIGIDFLGRYYPSPAMCILVGTCACIAMIQVCRGLENTVLCKPLAFIGQNSLILLCIHYLESIIWFNERCRLPFEFIFVVRYVMDLALLYVVVILIQRVKRMKQNKLIIKD